LTRTALSVTAFKAGKFCFVRAVDNFPQAVQEAIKSMRLHGITRVQVHVGMRLIWQRG
jgi:methylase of polypeptide subunit release factors